MANPLKKTMVYLGLADEEFEYEEEQPRESVAAPRAQPHAPQQTAAAAAPAPQPRVERAPVVPIRKNTPVRAQAVPEMNEILTVHPRQYRDAQAIAEAFRDGIPVIINLSQMNDSDARRLIDFASGLSQGLLGKIERVTNKVFLLSPQHVSVLGEQKAAGEGDSSFFNQA
ncbi:cell division protein SepF [Gryllotalpicola daejeonensis]|jgi:cell division inhibitor SepF|uniref:Cell division protein SepF n=1 Tax=Gryllotalpicola daejeonensis TaxID=993087 RepID=A0ABP7ZDG0_9MICO